MRFPVTIRKWNSSAKIYQATKKYPYYRLCYQADGKRNVLSFKTYSEARQEAQRVTGLLHSGAGVVAALTKEEANSFRSAQEKLIQLGYDLSDDGKGVKITLEDAIAEFAAARRKLKETTLSAAVDGYLSTVAQVRRVSIRDASAEFLRQREQRTITANESERPSLSPEMLKQDRCRLNRFAQHFKMDVCDLKKETLDLFFDHHLRKLSAKTRNHYRGTLNLFIQWATGRDYLPRNHRLAESDGLKPSGKNSEPTISEEVAIYSAREFAALLAQADDELRPFLAIAGLAGVRTREFLRLEWEDVWRRPGYLEVSASKGKTRKRRLVPINPALTAWLALHASQRTGRIFPYDENTLYRRMDKAAKAAAVKRRDNALRHGYISHRLALVQNEHQVAQEAGTSPTMIHRSYRELVTLDEAKAWFAVLPPEAANNIVPMAKGGAA